MTDSGTQASMERPRIAQMSMTRLTKLLDDLKSTPAPSLERSVLDRLGITSGTVQAQVNETFECLGLMGEDKKLTRRAERLIESRGDEGSWQKELWGAIQFGFGAFIDGIDLSNAVEEDIKRRFRDRGVSGDVLNRGYRFLMHACKEAGIEVSAHLLPKRGGSRSGARRSPKKKAVKRRQEEETTKTNGPDEGIMQFPIYLPGKAMGHIQVPRSITTQDVAMIQLQIKVIEAYAKQHEGDDDDDDFSIEE